MRSTYGDASRFPKGTRVRSRTACTRGRVLHVWEDGMMRVRWVDGSITIAFPSMLEVMPEKKPKEPRT